MRKTYYRWLIILSFLLTFYLIFFFSAYGYDTGEFKEVYTGQSGDILEQEYEISFVQSLTLFIFGEKESTGNFRLRSKDGQYCYLDADSDTIFPFSESSDGVLTGTTISVKNLALSEFEGGCVNNKIYPFRDFYKILLGHYNNLNNTNYVVP